MAKQLHDVPLQKVLKDWTVVEIAEGDYFNTIVRPQFREEIGAWVRKNGK